MRGKEGGKTLGGKGGNLRMKKARQTHCVMLLREKKRKGYNLACAGAG